VDTLDRELADDTQGVSLDSLRIEGLILRRTADGRQMYDPRSKAALVKLCRKSGVSVARAAMENGVNANLLRKWITGKRKSRTTRIESRCPAKCGHHHDRR
jgi:Transposase